MISALDRWIARRRLEATRARIQYCRELLAHGQATIAMLERQERRLYARLAVLESPRSLLRG